MTKDTPSRKGPVSLLVIAGLFILGPLWGLLGTVIGMIQAFGELQSGGDPNTEALAEHIDFSLRTTAIGIAMEPIGVILLVVAIIWLVKVNRRRQESSNQNLEHISDSANAV